jgi:hypothetical protein
MKNGFFYRFFSCIDLLVKEQIKPSQKTAAFSSPLQPRTPPPSQELCLSRRLLTPHACLLD